MIEDDSTQAIAPERLHMASEDKWYAPDAAADLKALRDLSTLAESWRGRAAKLLR